MMQVVYLTTTDSGLMNQVVYKYHTLGVNHIIYNTVHSPYCGNYILQVYDYHRL